MQKFSPILSISFHFCDIVHWSTKVLNFNDVQLLYFSFCSFGIISKKQLPNPRSQIFTPMFFSKSFIALVLIFKILIHFQFRIWCPFSCWHITAPSPFDDKTVLSAKNCHGILVENQSTRNVSVYFWTCNAIPLIYFKPGKLKPVALFFFPNIVLANLHTLNLYMDVRTTLSIPQTSWLGFYKDFIEKVDQFGSTVILTILSSIPERKISFHLFRSSVIPFNTLYFSEYKVCISVKFIPKYFNFFDANIKINAIVSLVSFLVCTLL